VAAVAAVEPAVVAAASAAAVAAAGAAAVAAVEIVAVIAVAAAATGNRLFSLRICATGNPLRISCVVLFRRWEL